MMKYHVCAEARLRRLRQAVPAVFAAALAACLLAAPVSAGAAASAPASAPVGLTDLQVSQDAGAMQSWAGAQGATGFFWDPAAKTFVVRVPDARMTATRAALAATRGSQEAALSTLPVTIRPAAVTAQDVNASLAVLQNQNWDPGVKKYTWAFYYDVQRDVTVVETNAPAAVADTLKRLVKSPIDLEHTTFQLGGAKVSPSRGPAIAAAARKTRNNDQPPFYGGAAIVNSDTGELCTTGFAFDNQLGADLMLTAGHCGNPDNVFRASKTSRNSGATVGTVLEKPSFPTWDSEAISCECSHIPFAGRIWTSGTTSVPVKGTATPVVGQKNWYTSGISTNLVSGRKITSTNAELCVSGKCTKGLMAFKGGKSCKSGDSGAPVFTQNGQGARIGGTYVGISGNGTMFAEKWSSLQSVYSGDPQVLTS